MFTNFLLCPECDLPFDPDSVKGGRRKSFCTDTCRTHFHNARHLKQKYHTTLRRGQRALALQRAAVMLSEGKTSTQVQAETGLGPRVLQRSGVLA